MPGSIVKSTRLVLRIHVDIDLVILPIVVSELISYLCATAQGVMFLEYSVRGWEEGRWCDWWRAIRLLASEFRFIREAGTL
jgi:hypothetical protein